LAIGVSPMLATFLFDVIVASFFCCIYFFLCYGYHRELHSFPTRRSSDLQVEPAVVGGDLRSLDQLLPLQQQVRAAHGTDLVQVRSEEHTSELQSRFDLVCRLLLEKNKYTTYNDSDHNRKRTRIRYNNALT